MRKASTTTPEEMAQEQIRRDIAMTALERMELAFELSEFALSIRKGHPSVSEPSPIKWIELSRVRSDDPQSPK